MLESTRSLLPDRKSMMKSSSPPVHQGPRLLLSSRFGISHHFECAWRDVEPSLATKMLAEKAQVAPAASGWKLQAPSLGPSLPQLAAGYPTSLCEWTNIEKRAVQSTSLAKAWKSLEVKQSKFARVPCTRGGRWCRKMCGKENHIHPSLKTTAYFSRDPLLNNRLI